MQIDGIGDIDATVKRFTDREIERETILREHLAMVALLVRRAGGRVEIPVAEIGELPPLSQLKIATSIEADRVVIRLVE